MIRDDFNLRPVCVTHLVAVQHLMRPDTLHVLNQAPAEAGARLCNLLFNGVLTERGGIATGNPNL